MALPLPTLTFYRMPDKNPTSASVDGMLNGIYNSLSSPTDYRGNAISSSHIWTWATSSVGGITNAVYSTATPSGSGLTTNFAIIIAGTSSSATPTMATPDAFTSSVPNVGIVKKPGVYSDWINSNPMTSGLFSGYWKMAPVTANSASTVIRSYVSQESIHVSIIVNGTTQYWTHIGACIEPHTSYASGNTSTAEPDDRLVGMMTSFNGIPGGLISSNAPYPAHNTSNGGNHGGLFYPDLNFFGGDISVVYKYAHAVTSGVKDLAGNWVTHNMLLGKNTSFPVKTHGKARSYFVLGRAITTSNVIRSGSTDLYHALLANTGSTSEAQALKAIS